jgi:hypothetical protein
LSVSGVLMPFVFLMVLSPVASKPHCMCTLSEHAMPSIQWLLTLGCGRFNAAKSQPNDATTKRHPTWQHHNTSQL